MADDNSDKELDLTVAGQHVRAKGYRLIDLLWVFTAAAIGYGAYALAQHKTETEQTMRDLAVAIKESGKAQVEAISKLVDEQKKANEKQTEQMAITNCLLDPALKNNQNASDVCKRIVRGR